MSLEVWGDGDDGREGEGIVEGRDYPRGAAMLTEMQRAAYERAAVALAHGFTVLEPGPMAIAWRNADWKLAELPNYDPTDFHRIDLEAAFILRECIAKGEPLP